MFRFPIYLPRRKLQREFGAFAGVRDNFPKYVVTMDELDMSRDGIKHRNIRDFLLAKCSSFHQKNGTSNAEMKNNGLLYYDMSPETDNAMKCPPGACQYPSEMGIQLAVWTFCML